MKLDCTLAWFGRFIISTDSDPGMLTFNLTYINMLQSQKILSRKTWLKMLSKEQHEETKVKLALLCLSDHENNPKKIQSL